MVTPSKVNGLLHPLRKVDLRSFVKVATDVGITKGCFIHTGIQRNTVSEDNGHCGTSLGSLCTVVKINILS